MPPRRERTVAHRDLIAERRQLVARLRLRHVTERDIVAALAREGKVNPITGAPWSPYTIHMDCVALRTAWQQDAAAATEEHQAALLAELREARREAWQAKALELVLRGIKQEADLLGLNAPQQVDLTVRVKALAAALGIDEAEALAEAEAVLREGRRAPTR